MARWKKDPFGFTFWTPPHFAISSHDPSAQTMRSWATLQPGEVFSCFGCHESRLSPPPPLTYTPIAMQYDPVKLEPFYGPRRGFTFDKEIQPIFNAKCISCHKGGTDGGGLDLRQGSAYNNLTRHNSCEAFSKYVKWFHAEDSPILQPPNRAGSIKSRLDSILDKGHKTVAITDEELRKIRCWIDLGVPQWGTYQEAHPGSEGNLNARNTWLTQEKKNIADYLLTVGTAAPFDGRGGSSCIGGMRDFAIICSRARTGVIRIHLTVPSRAEGQTVRIRLYNQKGALVSTLLDKPLEAGLNTLTFYAGVRAAGQYVMELHSRWITKTVPVAILK